MGGKMRWVLVCVQGGGGRKGERREGRRGDGARKQTIISSIKVFGKFI